MPHARAIVSGVCCATALCIGGLIGPPGAALALLALPLPALVVGGVGGVAHAAASALAASGVMTSILGWPIGVAYLLLAGMPAVLGVLMLRRAWRLEPTLAAALAATALGGLALVVATVPDLSVWQQAMASGWRASFDGALDLYRDLGMSAEQLAELETARETLADTLLTFLPALLVISTLGVWLLNLRLSSRWAGWPQLQGLSRWRSPDWMIWLLIASGFALFVPSRPMVILAQNVFAITLACYFAQGLAIVSYFLQRFGLPRGLRIAAYVVILFQQLAAGLVVALGVFDLWGDFRHLTAQPVDAAVGSDSSD